MYDLRHHDKFRCFLEICFQAANFTFMIHPINEQGFYSQEKFCLLSLVLLYDKPNFKQITTKTFHKQNLFNKAIVHNSSTII